MFTRLNTDHTQYRYIREFFIFSSPKILPMGARLGIKKIIFCISTYLHERKVYIIAKTSCSRTSEGDFSEAMKGHRRSQTYFDKRLNVLSILYDDHQHPLGRIIPEEVEILIDHIQSTSDDHVGRTEHRNVVGRDQRDRPSVGVRVGRTSARTVVVPLRVEHGHYGGRLGGVVGRHFQAPLQRSERFVHVCRQCGRGQLVWPVRSVRRQASCCRHQDSD